MPMTLLFFYKKNKNGREMKNEGLAVGKWCEGLPVLPQNLVWKTDGLKYLGIHVGNEKTEKKNWEEILEKIDSKLLKWKWLHPQKSYRGKVLISNNLVASLLWHRLAKMVKYFCIKFLLLLFFSCIGCYSQYCLYPERRGVSTLSTWPAEQSPFEYSLSRCT